MLELENIILPIITLFLLILVLKKSNQIKNLISESKKHYSLLDAINIPIFYKDINGQFVGCNRAFDISFKDLKKQAIDDLKEFRGACVKECELTYDNDIKKLTIVNFTNYFDGSVGILFDVSQMKSDKMAILNKKESLELAFKGSREGYWEWDVKSNALLLSKRAKEILGYEEDEKAPDNIVNWINLVESYDMAKTNEALSMHIRGESEFIDIEHRLKTSFKDLWVNFRGKGVYGANNKIVKVYGTLRDISSQRGELIKIKKQRDLFMTFMDNLPALSFIKDKQGRYIYVNSFFKKLLGFKEWKNRTAQEIFDKKISEHIAESDREAFYEGKHKHKEYITNEEGIKFFFETYKFPVESEKERVLCGFGLDVTQERIFQDRTELYSKIFDSTNEAILLTDEKGITVDVNSTFQEITGFNESEIVGKNPSIRQSGKHNKKFYTQMWRDLLTKGVWAGEMFNKYKNGTIHSELMNISAIKNKRGEITNFVAILQSKEHQKLVESRLKKMAHYDTLTNLPNKTLFIDRLNHATQRADRSKSMLGIILVDIDCFKDTSAIQEESISDIILSEIAKRLVYVVRNSDTVARLEKDKFAIMLEKIGQFSDISHIANKIISEVKIPISAKNKKEYTVGIGLGVSIYPNQAKSKKELLEFANSAMCEAKSSGKDCYKIYGNLDC